MNHEKLVAMNEDAGWIKLSRKLLQSKYYLGEKFTRPMCWIDLLLLAEWRSERTFFHRGIQVVVKRGQIAMSLDELHKRWNLSVNTVRRRLDEMCKDGRIEWITDNVISRITIINYEKYQGTDCTQDIKVEHQESPSASSDTDIEPIEVVSQNPIEVADVIEDDTNLPDLSPAKEKTKVDCEFVLKLYHHLCPSLPKVLKLSDKRKSKIRIRFEEMDCNFEIMQTVFEKAEASRFLRGDNNRGWKADFDWIFTNSTNWVKILEGKYDNNDQVTTPIIRNDNGTTFTADSQSAHRSGQTWQQPTSSQRQRMSVVATLAKITAEQEGGNFPSRVGSEGEL